MEIDEEDPSGRVLRGNRERRERGVVRFGARSDVDRDGIVGRKQDRPVRIRRGERG
jgi:hypothetical protein